MNTVLCFKNNIAKISLLSLLAMVVLSCNSLKKVSDHEYLIVKNELLIDSLEVNNEAIESLIYQKPNAALLGYPLRLNLYNIAKENPDSLFQTWLNNNPNRKKRLTKALSAKQVERLGESFLVSGLSNWLKDIGEAPVVLDTSRTRRSLQRLSSYYYDRGYFNNTTHYSIDSTGRKQRATVGYQISLGHPFIVDSISNEISSNAIDSLYFINSKQSLIQTGQQFDRDIFNAERERLTTIFRNSGVRNFQESSITFDIARDTTAKGADQKMNIVLNIGDLKKRGENEVTTAEYKVEKINHIDVYTDYLSSDKKDSLIAVEYGDYTIYYSDKFQIRPKTLANAIFFKKGNTYRDLDKIRTSRQLNSLNIFKYPNIIFEEDSSANSVNTSIYLAPKTKYSLGTNFDVSRSNIRRLGVGVNASLLIRNIFKGAENLSISGDATFGLLSSPSFQEDFFSEIGGDITLDFPRIWFPFLNTNKLIPNYTLPKTRVAIGTSFQRNIGLDKQTLNSVLSYNWTPSEFKKHNIELLNVQYVRNVNSNRFFNVYRNTYNVLNRIATEDAIVVNPIYFDGNGNLTTPVEALSPESIGTDRFIDDVLSGEIPITSNGLTLEDFNEVNSIEEREQRLTENNLIFTTNYTFNKNNRNGITDNSFYQFRWKLEGAGNLLAGLSGILPFNEKDTQLLVFNVPFSQYLKTELDFVKYWDLSRSNVLAARTFFGIAIPYGNSNNIPFVRSYFGGGSNDNRAWFPYSLGPGRTSAVNDFNEANLKLALNLEYRFPIAGAMNGAIFADAGNIWNVFDDVTDPDATFSGISSLKDIALGTGFGLRYDFTYFLFRLDLGFKTYNPAEIQSKRWFRTYNFANSVLQIGINYPF
ncbi:translocation and assembly module lipoprotein TamL [Maribacter antarcticus]|uniref:translocation and assembly module lipoprotein TamL n=1 Tax=Maribacter antarcticus TaxID=505250 RepID=UPI00056A9222|nr:BamA/TamA family outer membrane protein [Maribacter antarcticus]